MLLFWERGYDTVSIRDLTGAMGISPPSLYAAFTDKETLFAEAVDAYAGKYGGYIEESMVDGRTAREAVTRLLTRAAHQQTLPGRPAGCLILDGATNHTVASAPIVARLRARRCDTAAMIERRILVDIESGVLPASTDPHWLATFVMTVWRGLSQLARDGRDRDDLEGAVAIAMTAWPDDNHDEP